MKILKDMLSRIKGIADDISYIGSNSQVDRTLIRSDIANLVTRVDSMFNKLIDEINKLSNQLVDEPIENEVDELGSWFIPCVLVADTINFVFPELDCLLHISEVKNVVSYGQGDMKHTRINSIDSDTYYKTHLTLDEVNDLAKRYNMANEEVNEYE